MPVPVARALSGAKSTGAPLPQVPALQGLYALGCRPRLGQMTMVVGQPGSQKSGFTMWWVQQMGLPTLYCCLDMSQTTAFVRMASMVTGQAGDTVAEGIQNGLGDVYAEQLEDSKVHFVFDSEMDLDDLADELDSFVETWDAYPGVLVIDNLLDLASMGESENESYKTILKELKALAHSTGMAVFVLHHVSEGVGDPAYPSPRKAILQKVAQTPEVVLSVALDGYAFRVAPVKSRNSQQDASGKTYAELRADPERTTFYPRSSHGYA